MRLSSSLIFIFSFIIFSCFSQLENYEKYMPSSTSGEIIHHTYYSLSYLEDHEIPEWTIYLSTKSRTPIWDMISNEKKLPDGTKPFLRSSNFIPDPKVKNKSSSSIDYRGSGYDRGHMVPAADMVFSKIAISEAFYFSNVSPQKAAFNRGIWRNLEIFISSELIPKYDSLIIITGCVLRDSTNFNLSKTKIGNVSVPFFYYKVIVDVKRKSSIAFLIPNNGIYKTSDNMEAFLEYICPIKDLERLTGVDFFYKLNDKEELDFEDGINN